MQLSDWLYQGAYGLVIFLTLGSLALWQWDPSLTCYGASRREQLNSIIVGTVYLTLVLISQKLFSAHLGLWWIVPPIFGAAIFVYRFFLIRHRLRRLTIRATRRSDPPSQGGET